MQLEGRSSQRASSTRQSTVRRADFVRSVQMTVPEIGARLRDSREYSDANGGALYSTASFGRFFAVESEHRFRLTDGVGVFHSSWVVGHLELAAQPGGSTELRLAFALGPIPLRWTTRLLATWIALGGVGGALVWAAPERERLTAEVLAVAASYAIVTLLLLARALVVLLTTRDHRASVSRALGLPNDWHRP